MIRSMEFAAWSEEAGSTYNEGAGAKGGKGHFIEMFSRNLMPAGSLVLRESF